MFGRRPLIALIVLLTCSPTLASSPKVAIVRGGAARRLARLETLDDAKQPFEAARLADELLGEAPRLRSGQGAARWAARDDGVFVGFRTAVHRRIARFSPAALAAFRARVDAVVEPWYRDGVAGRNANLLRRVVRQARASSWGEPALWALGEIELQQGNYQRARTAWLPLIERDAYGAAAVLARLALVSIRAGDFHRAESEVAQLRGEHPEAVGRLAGRDQNLSKALTALLAQARNWNRIKPLKAPLEHAWTTPIAPSPTNTYAPPKVANDAVYVVTSEGIHGVHLTDGQPLRRDASLLRATSCENLRLTVSRERLFTTCFPNVDDEPPPLVGLDLSRDAALFLQITPPDDARFVGDPVVVDDQIIVATQAGDAQIRASVVSYDMWTGKLRWQCSLGGAAGMSAGACEVFVADGVAYAVTHLGMIAAIDVADGAPLWLTTYDRKTVEIAAGGSPRPRGIYDAGLLIAAPADAGQLIAIDASTGAIVWTRPAIVTQILPAGDNRLVTLGSSLQLVNLSAGDAIDISPVNIGAVHDGVVDGETLYLSVGETLLALDLATANNVAIEAAAAVRGLPSDAMLAIGEGTLVARGANELAAFRPSAQPPTTPEASDQTDSESTPD